MPIKKSELYSSLWKSCDELRGGMDASQYKDYVLVLLFMKYVSDKAASQKGYLLDVPKGGGIADMVALKGEKEIGDKVVKPPKGIKWGSLKSLENVLSKWIEPEQARSILSPLVGIYELRHADAHLPSSELKESLGLVGVDDSMPFVFQGYMLLHACVSSLYDIAKVIHMESQ